MNKLFTVLSFMMLLACQDPHSDQELPITASPDVTSSLTEPTAVRATPPPPSLTYEKDSPESLIECIKSESSGLDSQCRMTQARMILAENPEHEMRTYRVECAMTCLRGRSELTAIQVRAQAKEEGEVVGLIRTGNSETFLIRGSGDLVIEDVSPQMLLHRSFSQGCSLVVHVEQI